MWQEICLLSLGELEADKTLPPQTTICRAATDLAVESAVFTAQKLVSLARARDVDGTLATQIDAGYDRILMDSVQFEDGEESKVPDFITAEEQQRALEQMAKTREGRERANFKSYDKPTEENFQAFLKAHRSNESWRNEKAVERYRKEYLERKKAAGLDKKKEEK
jgi:hypothetical protein